MDNNIITSSPTDSRLFIWFAQYLNGDYFYEYDTKFNQFDSIDKSNLKQFGICGLGMVMKYDVSTGVFDICGRKISFVFREAFDDYEIKLSNADTIYNDCISYKSASTVIIGRDQGSSSITGYHFGYKVKLDNGFNLKVIVHVPMYGRVNMDISITPSEDINGGLYIIRNDKTEKVEQLKLIKNQTSNVNWIVV